MMSKDETMKKCLKIIRANKNIDMVTGFNNKISHTNWRDRVTSDLSDIWDLCNKKGGNCREKSNLCLYDCWAEISPDLALTQFLFFPAVSPLSTAKVPYNR
jgi:hypothetical protein